MIGGFIWEISQTDYRVIEIVDLFSLFCGFSSCTTTSGLLRIDSTMSDLRLLQYYVVAEDTSNNCIYYFVGILLVYFFYFLLF